MVEKINNNKASLIFYHKVYVILNQLLIQFLINIISLKKDKPYMIKGLSSLICIFSFFYLVLQRKRVLFQKQYLREGSR